MINFDPSKQSGAAYARSVAGIFGTSFATGAVGAGVGYAAGQQLGVDPSVSSALGASVGMGVGLGAQFAFRNPGATLSAVGTPLYHVGKAIKNNVTKDGVMSTLENVGSMAIKGVKGVGMAAEVGGVAAAQTAGEFAAIARGMLKVNPANTIGYSLNGFGKVAVGAGVIGSSLKKAFDTHEKIHMGTSDGLVATATPGTTSSTMNYAGATGDLNFSMYANRRG